MKFFYCYLVVITGTAMQEHFNKVYFIHVHLGKLTLALKHIVKSPCIHDCTLYPRFYTRRHRDLISCSICNSNISKYHQCVSLTTPFTDTSKWH